MRIDVSTIEGYAEMTAEEKLKALESFELPNPDYTGYVKKEVFDKTASEAASFKKQLREKQTAEETAKQEADERFQSMEAELKALKAEKQIAEYTSSLLNLGYEGKLAASTAKAMAEGDMNTVFKNHAIHNATMQQAVEKKLVNATPAPVAGDSTSIKTKQDFAKMSALTVLNISTAMCLIPVCTANGSVIACSSKYLKLFCAHWMVYSASL